MKSERRHELRENDLVHALGSSRNFLQEYGGRVGMAALIALGVVAIATLTVRSRAAAMEDVWRRRAQLRFEDVETGRESLESLRVMTGDVTNRAFVMASLLEQGRQSLRLSQQVPDPPDRELTEQAEHAFNELIERFPQNPMALGVGLHGLATVEQNRFVIDGELAHKERAHDFLTRIITDAALNGMPFQKLAVDRRNALDTAFIKVRFHYPVPEPAAAVNITAKPGAEIKVNRVEPAKTP